MWHWETVFLIVENENAPCIRGAFISTLLLLSCRKNSSFTPKCISQGKCNVGANSFCLSPILFTIEHLQDNRQQICSSDVLDVSKHRSHLWAKFFILHVTHTFFSLASSHVYYTPDLLEAPLGKSHISYTICSWIDSFLVLNALTTVLQLCGFFQQLSCLKPENQMWKTGRK